MVQPDEHHRQPPAADERHVEWRSAGADGARHATRARAGNDGRLISKQEVHSDQNQRVSESSPHPDLPPSFPFPSTHSTAAAQLALLLPRERTTFDCVTSLVSPLTSLMTSVLLCRCHRSTQPFTVRSGKSVFLVAKNCLPPRIFDAESKQFSAFQSETWF